MDKPPAWRLAATARVAAMATVDARGTPHLVPCVFALSGDTVYSGVDGKPKRNRDLQRVRNIAADARVALLIHHWDEDWTRLWWVRLDGRARIVTAAAEQTAARQLLLDKYAQYRDPAELDPVIAIDIEDWRAWSAAGPEEA